MMICDLFVDDPSGALVVVDGSVVDISEMNGLTLSFVVVLTFTIK